MRRKGINMAFDKKEYLLRLNQCKDLRGIYHMPFNLCKDRQIVEGYLKIVDLWAVKIWKNITKEEPVYLAWYNLIEHPDKEGDRVVSFTHDFLMKIEKGEKTDLMAVNMLFNTEEQNILAALVNKVNQIKNQKIH